MTYKLIKSSGFTLIETLVSLLVMSVGILSFALLQAESLRATHVSMQRTKAIHFATDIIERMRANTEAITEYTITATTAPSSTGLSVCSDSINETTVDCTPVQLAAFDKWEWRQAINGNNDSGVNQSGIVSGTGSVKVTSAHASGTGKPYSVTVVIAWNDRSDANSYTLTSVIL